MIKQLIFATLMIFSSVATASMFVNVSDDQAIRANSGDVVVIVNALPDEHVLFIDQKNVDVEVAAYGSEYKRTAYVFKNMDRGTHELTLVDGSYQEKIKIHVLRVHQ